MPSGIIVAGLTPLTPTYSIQKSHKNWSERGCSLLQPLVILSVSEESRCPNVRFFADAQNDTEGERLFSYDDLLWQEVGINGLAPAMVQTHTI